MRLLLPEVDVVTDNDAVMLIDWELDAVVDCDVVNDIELLADGEDVNDGLIEALVEALCVSVGDVDEVGDADNVWDVESDRVLEELCD